MANQPPFVGFLTTPASEEPRCPVGNGWILFCICFALLSLLPGDGTDMVAVQRTTADGLPGEIWQSSDMGDTWYQTISSPRGYWSAVSASLDFSVLVAVQDMDESGQTTTSIDRSLL